MTDYKELIEDLRDDYKAWGDGRAQNFFEVTLRCKQAADAIEQLVKEREYIPTDTLRKYHAWLLEEYHKNPTSENLHSIDIAISWLKVYANYKCVNVDFCN